MKLRFYNAQILTMESTEIFSGEVHTDGDTIIYIGKEKKDGSFDREINLCGNLIMPSFKNAHTHSAMTFLRSYADDMPLNDWLFKQVFPMEDKLTPDDVYELTKLAALEYFSGGTTAAFDMYFHPDRVIEASVETGLRIVICGAAAIRLTTIQHCHAWRITISALTAWIPLFPLKWDSTPSTLPISPY